MITSTKRLNSRDFEVSIEPPSDGYDMPRSVMIEQLDKKTYRITDKEYSHPCDFVRSSGSWKALVYNKWIGFPSAARHALYIEALDSVLKLKVSEVLEDVENIHNQTSKRSGHNGLVRRAIAWAKQCCSGYKKSQL